MQAGGLCCLFQAGQGKAGGELGFPAQRHGCFLAAAVPCPRWMALIRGRPGQLCLGAAGAESGPGLPVLPKAKDITSRLPAAASPILSKDPQLLILWIAQILESPCAVLHPQHLPALRLLMASGFAAALGWTATDSTELGGATNPGAEPRANPRRIPGTDASAPCKPPLRPWGPISPDPILFPRIYKAARAAIGSALNIFLPDTALASAAFGHGQGDRSLCPSSVSARAHEQRQDGNPSCTPLPEQAVASANNFGAQACRAASPGDGMGRDVPAASPTPATRAAGGEVCTFNLVRAARDGVASRKRCGWCRAPKFKGPREVGWRPLTPYPPGTPGGEGWGDRGRRHPPAPAPPSSARSAGWTGAGASQGCRVRPFAFLHLPWPLASWASRGRHQPETVITGRGGTEHTAAQSPNGRSPAPRNRPRFIYLLVVICGVSPRFCRGPSRH